MGPIHHSALCGRKYDFARRPEPAASGISVCATERSDLGIKDELQLALLRQFCAICNMSLRMQSYPQAVDCPVALRLSIKYALCPS